MVVSVEETHVNTENECEKSNGESESSTDKFTSEVDSDKRDEHFSSAVNGMKSAAITPADKNPISDFEEPVEKEESEEIVTDNVTAVLSNGINHDVGEDSQEKIEEKVDENILQSAEVEGHSPESDCVSEEKDNEVVTRMETDEIPSTDVKENQEERAETIMNDESADSKDIEPNEEVSVEKFEQRDEIEEIVISAPSPTSVEIAKSPDNLKTEIPDVEAADEENITKNVLAEVEQKNDCKEDETADVEKKPEVVQSESNVKTISKKNSQNSEKECSKEGIANITGIAVKRRAEIVDEVEPDREGGISSSSSSSSSGSGSEAENTQDCKRIRFDESIFEEDERERLIREFVERSTESSEEIGKNCDKLQHEIAALSDLARDKELEWNSIMRLLKLKEEMLERILFKKRHLECQNKPDFEANLNKIYKNLVSSSSLLDQTRGSCTPASINNHVTVVPINPSTSANNGMLNASSQEYYKAIMNSSMLGTSDALSKLRPHRPILPKPPVSSSCSSVSQQPFQSSFLSHSHSTSQSGAQSLMQSNSLIVDQNSIIGEGRQGAIVDVKSIIADFRSKNPDSLPRRGRRTLPFSNRVPDMGIGPRFLPNTALLSMANMALGSGSHVRTSVSSTTHNDHRPNNFLLGQDGSGPSSVSRSDLQLRQANIDSLMLAVNSTGGTFPVNCNQSNNSINCNSNINTTSNNNSANCSTNSSTISSNNSNNNNNNNNNNSNNNSSSNNNNNNSFQEALVKFAKMNEKRDMSSNSAALHVSSKKSASHLPPPPPYPEVTLHPVVVTQSSGSSPVHNSLLHGILTKSNNGCNREHQASVSSGNSGMSATTVNNIQHRPTTFSPTLAKLLTAPERSRTNRSNVSSSNRNPKTTLSEILNSKKTRTEVTITPVTTTSCSSKSGSNVVLVDDDDESETADRLVIDEGREVLGDSTSNVIPADQVPECQGCHKKAAQFVCAGCGNQWYCSRECQVHAWEEHSEMCSG